MWMFPWMKRGKMKKSLLILFLLGLSGPVMADCFEGDMAFAREKLLMARTDYETCAKMINDAASFYRLGQIYLTAKGVPVDRTRALLYFRYGAENGYAPAQRELAKLMVSPLLPTDAMGRVQKKVVAQKSRLPQLPHIDNTLELSDFAWVLLASERPENKWFYPSPALSDEEAAKMVSALERSRGKAEKEKAVRQASQFKEQRLIWAARETYNDKDFNQFMRVVFPSNGQPDYVQRTQAVEKLKQDILNK